MVEGSAITDLMDNLVNQLLSKITKERKRIVVVGDVMVDRWIHGRLDTCQDGCPKLVQESVVEVPGGAANAERCLRNWDVNTSLYGYSISHCPVKCRYTEGTKIVFRADDDGPRDLGEGYHWARKLPLEMVRHAGAVLLSDYDKGFLTPGFIQEVAKLCKDRGILCVADVKRGPEVYDGCTIKANEDYHDKYYGALPFDNMVVTYGERNPVTWIGPIPYGLGYDLPPVICVNHVGAGDCFAAHLTLALAYGFSFKEAAALAHSAGRVYVQHSHNRPPLPDEIMADMVLATAK